MRNWNAQPKQPVTVKIPYALWQRAKAANIEFSKATINGLMAQMGEATQSEQIDACRKIISAVQETGVQDGSLKPEYCESLAGALKILSILESGDRISKPQLEDLTTASLPLNSDVLRTSVLEPEENALLQGNVTFANPGAPKAQQTET